MSPRKSTRLAIAAKKIAATERRTAVMERLAIDRANREVRYAKIPRHGGKTNTADFAARRAEIDAILETARAEIHEQLRLLCEQWQSSSDVTVARCCADVAKLTETLR